MDVLICQPLFDGSLKDKDLFGTSEQSKKNVLMLLVIGSLSSLLCWLCLYKKKNNKTSLGIYQKRRGEEGKKTPAVPVFKIRQFVFQSLQVIAIICLHNFEHFQMSLLYLQYKPFFPPFSWFIKENQLLHIHIPTYKSNLKKKNQYTTAQNVTFFRLFLM